MGSASRMFVGCGQGMTQQKSGQSRNHKRHGRA